jgi:hypothetical protein
MFAPFPGGWYLPPEKSVSAIQVQLLALVVVASRVSASSSRSRSIPGVRGGQYGFYAPELRHRPPPAAAFALRPAGRIGSDDAYLAKYAT